MAEQKKTKKKSSASKPAKAKSRSGGSKARKDGRRQSKAKTPAAAKRGGGKVKAAAERKSDVVKSAAEDLPLGAAANAALAGRAALAGTRAAGKAVSGAASKARTPLVAGGGLAAGVAGGLAIVHRRNGRNGGSALDFDHVISAARRAGSLGEEISRVASLMEQANTRSKH